MLTASLLALTHAPQNAQPFMRWTDIHGDNVVFTSEGDLRLGDRTSEKPTD